MPVGSGFQDTLKPGRSYKDILKKDLNDYNRGQAGLSDTQKQKSISDASMQANQATQAAQTDIRRESLASEGFGGEYADAQRDVGKQAAEAAAGVARSVDQASEELAAKKTDALTERLNRAQMEKRRRLEADMNVAKDAANMIVQGIMGGMGDAGLKGVLGGIGHALTGGAKNQGE